MNAIVINACKYTDQGITSYTGTTIRRKCVTEFTIMLGILARYIQSLVFFTDELVKMACTTPT